MRRILGACLLTVKDLREALQSIPDDAVINPVGATDLCMAYDSEANLIYVDNEDWVEEFVDETEDE